MKFTVMTNRTKFRLLVILLAVLLTGICIWILLPSDMEVTAVMNSYSKMAYSVRVSNGVTKETFLKSTEEAKEAITTKVVAAVVNKTGDWFWVFGDRYKKIGDKMTANRGGSLEGQHHSGVDAEVYGKTGIPVYSPVDGTVVNCAFDITKEGSLQEVSSSHGGMGNYVYIKCNANGVSYTVRLMHLVAAGETDTYFTSGYMRTKSTTDWTPVKVGDAVKAGQVIGYVGMTGMTSGPHAHIDIQVNGSVTHYINPLLFYKDTGLQYSGTIGSTYLRYQAGKWVESNN